MAHFLREADLGARPSALKAMDRLGVRLAAQANALLRTDGAPDEAELARFLAHYERLTRAAIEALPGRADLVAHIAPDRSILALGTRE